MGGERNWAGNVAYQAAEIARPTNVDQLRQLVVAGNHLRVVGSRHSFNDIADCEAMLTTDGMPEAIAVDAAANTVTCNPAITYSRLATVLNEHGRALHNMASLPHITIAGAIATGTHGSGNRSGNLATAVSAIELMRSDGEIVHLTRGDPDFDGAVVHLGALGVVLGVQLEIEPAYQAAQHVFEDLAWSAVSEQFDAITSAGNSVSLFTTYAGQVEQLWIKRRQPAHEPNGFGARPASAEVHPVAGISAESCTPQRGVPGRWSDRMPHFKMGFTPSSGDELQSEVFVGRDDALDAIAVLRGLAATLAPQLLISEIRTVAADTLWMSPHYARDSVAFHFTWRRDVDAVTPLVTLIESELAAFDPRPHWGKLFTLDAAALATRYPRHADFVDLVTRFDPRRAFRNSWFERSVAG